MVDSLVAYFKEHALTVILLIVLGMILSKILVTISNMVVHKLVQPERFASKHEAVQREDTINSVLKYLIKIFVWIVVFMLILSELKIDIAPLLAGAGIAGIAIGFGAQSIVRDFFAGLFILSENQYRVGDVIRINNEISGTVEKITLRQTVMRNLDGMVHYISNGQITVVTNMTMHYSGVNLDVGVGYDTDIEKLERVVNKVGEAMAEDEKWKRLIKEAPKFLRVDDFAESAIIIKITGKTAPMKQWAVTGELRKRLKIAFDKNGIVIPYPQRVLHEAQNNKTTKSKAQSKK
jgi:small conductance mechanosensitive channel